MPDIEFWVSTTGNDLGDGTQNNPFLTIGRAQTAVREVLAEPGSLASDVIVNVGGGTYELPTTLDFGPADSGRDGHAVIYRAATGEEAVISGGRGVTDWTPVADSGLFLDPGVQLWKASVGLGVDTRQLYIDGERGVRAESNPAGTLENPVYPQGFRPTFDQIPDVSGIQYIPNAWNLAEDPTALNWFDPNSWTNVADIEAVLNTQWKTMSVPLDEVLPQSPLIPSLIAEYDETPVGLITMQDPAWTSANLYGALPKGTTTALSYTVALTGLYATTGIKAGMSIGGTGTGIVPGTTVAAVDSVANTLELSFPALESSIFPVSLSVADPATGELVIHPGIWSLWRVTNFVNAYEFLNLPGEWYLDRSNGDLFLVAETGVDPNTLDVQMPVLETLMQGSGVSNLTFQGLSFEYATWLDPNGPTGYVADQSGFQAAPFVNEPNTIGHAQFTVRTPGALSFDRATSITLEGNSFNHLGAVGVDFVSGPKDNRIAWNIFDDISSAAIQIGGVSTEDARPTAPAGVSENNLVLDNIITNVGAEFVDAAGIFLGFGRNNRIEGNFIQSVPWSGIAVGWGWGLLDDPFFPGLQGATPDMWGTFTTPTVMEGNQIVGNTITEFVQVVWDGGAIYTTGSQGTSPGNGTLIADNYAYNKRPDGGSNVFYTDGGSRFVTLDGNVSFGNEQGVLDLGPAFKLTDPLNVHNPLAALVLGNGLPYGSDIGGCVTYGDIIYFANRWQNLWDSTPFAFNPSDWPFNPLYYDICQYIDPTTNIQYPIDLQFVLNTIIRGLGAATDLGSTDDTLVFVQPTAVSVTRLDAMAGTASFGLMSLDDGVTTTLLANATGSSANALGYLAGASPAWLASEGQALGSAIATAPLGEGVWLPTASVGGAELDLASVQRTGNSFLATFEGGYQASFSLGGTRAIPSGEAGGQAVVTVQRLAAYKNGIAFYAADQVRGGIVVDGAVLLPGDPGYLAGALAVATTDGVVLQAGELPGYGQQATFEALSLTDARNYGLLVMVNGGEQIFSSYSAANPGGAVQILTFGDPSGGVTYGIEDILVTSGASDRDYNDLLVTLGWG